MFSPFLKTAWCDEASPANDSLVNTELRPFDTLVAGRRIALASTSSKIDQYAKEAEKKAKDLAKTAENKAKDIGKKVEKTVENAGYSCEFGSPKFYALCGLGGIVR